MQSEKFFYETCPIKITEAGRLKMNSLSWGILSDYYLEAVKLKPRGCRVETTATLRVGDHTGHVTCLVQGCNVALLFGLTKRQWQSVEKLSWRGEDLFYRYFKNGLNQNFNFEQKLFYYFCCSNQRKDALVAVFKRTVNTRQHAKEDAFLCIVELRKCSDALLTLYQNYLRSS